MKATEWTFDRIKEAFEKVAKDEAKQLSTVQEIMVRSTEYLRRIIAPVGGQGGVTMSYLCGTAWAMEFPQLLMDKVFDVPGVRVVPVSQLLEVTVVFLQSQLIEKIRTCFWTRLLTCPSACRANCGLSAVAAHQQGLGAKV